MRYYKDTYITYIYICKSNFICIYLWHCINLYHLQSYPSYIGTFSGYLLYVHDVPHCGCVLIVVHIHFFKDRIFGGRGSQSAIQRWSKMDQFASPKVLEPISSVYHCRQPQGWASQVSSGFLGPWGPVGGRLGPWECRVGGFSTVAGILVISDTSDGELIMVRLFPQDKVPKNFLDAVYNCALHLDVRLLPSNMQVGTFHSHKVRLHTVDSRGRPVVTTSSTMEKPPKRNSRSGDLEILPDLQ